MSRGAGRRQSGSRGSTGHCEQTLDDIRTTKKSTFKFKADNAAKVGRGKDEGGGCTKRFCQ